MGLKWCLNCAQNVQPQKNKGNLGCAFLVLLLLGIVLLFVPGFQIAALVILAVAVLLLVVGLLFEFASVMIGAHCPICKGKNLGPKR